MAMTIAMAMDMAMTVAMNMVMTMNTKLQKHTLGIFKIYRKKYYKNT